MTYDNFSNLCNSIGKSPSAVALELGISKSTVSHWKHQRNKMTAATALKIANYFGITVEELKTGIKKEPSVPKDEELDKNDAMWELRDAVLERFPAASSQEISALLNAVEGNSSDLTIQEIIAVAEILKRMTPADKKFLEGIFEAYSQVK